MLVLLYSVEELFDHRYYGYNGSSAAPFDDSEKRFSGFVYRYWFGFDIVKYQVYKGVLPGNDKAKCGLTDN